MGSSLDHVDKDVYYWEPKSLRIRRCEPGKPMGNPKPIWVSLKISTGSMGKKPWFFSHRPLVHPYVLTEELLKMGLPGTLV